LVIFKDLDQELLYFKIFLRLLCTLVQYCSKIKYFRRSLHHKTLWHIFCHRR